MVELAGEPAIAHELRWLARHGVSDVAINLSRHAHVLMEYVGNGSIFGMRVRYSVERSLLGTAGALRPLRDFFDQEEPFIVYYGDVVTDFCLDDAIAGHKRAGADATMVVHRGDDPTRAGMVEFDERCRITRLIEKPAASEVTTPWANSGIYVCGQTVLNYVYSKGSQDFAIDLFPTMLKDGCTLLASPTESQVIDFGSPARLLIAQEWLRERQC
jgi:NDP-sugar pyrophosphorylase family protein